MRSNSYKNSYITSETTNEGNDVSRKIYYFRYILSFVHSGLTAQVIEP